MCGGLLEVDRNTHNQLNLTLARIKVRGSLIGFILAKVLFEGFEINLRSLYSSSEMQLSGQFCGQLQGWWFKWWKMMKPD